MATESEGKSVPASEEPQTWWAKQRQEASSFNVEDCTECRYIAGFSMYGVAAYVARTGIKRQQIRGGSLWGAVPALITSALLASLGTARLLRFNPFSSEGNELGIDGIHKAFANVQKLGSEKPDQDNPGR